MQILHLIFLLQLMLGVLGCTDGVDEKFTSIDLPLNTTRNFYVFNNSIVFRTNERPFAHFYGGDVIFQHTLYSYNIETKEADSLKFRNGHYFTFDTKLNDSLFLLGYYDERTIRLIKNLRLHKENRDFKGMEDTTIEIIEYLMVYNGKLKVVDFDSVVTKININQYNRIFASFLDNAKEVNNHGQSITMAFCYNFPIIADSYDELVKKYNIVFKYNKFWCRNVEIEENFNRMEGKGYGFNNSESDSKPLETRIVPDHYWQILFTNKTAYSYQYTDPLLITTLNYDYPQSKRTEKLTYYWNKGVKISNELIGETDYIVLANSHDSELMIGRKSLSYYFSNTLDDRFLSNEKFELYRYYVKDVSIVMEKINSKNLIPYSIVLLSPRNYAINGLISDSIIKQKRMDSISIVQMDVYTNYPMLYYWKVTYTSSFERNFNELNRNDISFKAQSISFETDLYVIHSKGVLTLYKEGKPIENFNTEDNNKIVNICGNDFFILYQKVKYDSLNNKVYLTFYYQKK